MATIDYAIPASAIHAEFKKQGVNAVTTVPDLIQLAVHDAMKRDDAIKYVECANENQALTVAAGMYIGGLKPLVMMQNQGLFNVINTLRSVGIDGKLPLVLSVGAFGREIANLGQPITNSKRVLVNRVPTVVEALGLPFFHLETANDLDQIAAAFDAARAHKTAAIIHFGHYPSWD